MSSQPPPANPNPADEPHPDEDEEEEERILGDEAGDDDAEAFIDLNDPENRVMEIDGAAPPPEEEAANEPEGEFPQEKEPERDDAVFSWVCPTKEPLHAVAVHPLHPNVVAVGGEDEKATILDLADISNGSKPLGGHTDTVTHVAFSPDGLLLATGSMDCTVKLWNTATWELTFSLEDLAGEVEFLLWHPSSKVLLGGGADAQALLWNVAKGTVAQYFVGHRGAVTCAAWACEVKKVLTGSNDGSVMVFNPKTGETEGTINKELSPVSAGVTCVAPLTPQADIFVVGCEDGTMHVVSASRGRAVQSLEEIHEQAVEAIAVCTGSNIGLFASCSCDCKLVIWNTDFSMRSLTKCGEGITKLLWVDTLLFAGCTDGDTRVWDGRSAAGPPRTVLMGHRKLVLGLSVTPDASFVLSCADDGSVRAFVKERYSLDEPAIAAKALAEATSLGRAAVQAAEALD